MELSVYRAKRMLGRLLLKIIKFLSEFYNEVFVSTQNFAVTAGTAKNEDFTKSDAATTDKLIVAIYVNGAIKLTKKSAANGGSADEIAIVAATKYTLKMSAKDTLMLPQSGVSYKLLKIEGNAVTELFSGAITVSGAVEPAGDIEVGTSQSYSRTQQFQADGTLDVALPQNGYIEKILTHNAGGWNITIDVGSSVGGSDIVEAHDTKLPEYDEATLKRTYFSKDASTVIYVSSLDWDGGEIGVTIVWKVIG